MLSICITLFALSTMLTWALYGARCFSFLFGDKTNKTYYFLFILFIIIGACLKLDVVWLIAETFNGFMIIPNLIALLLLSNKVKQLTFEYFKETR